MDLNGKVAIVTGASRGIGRAIAVALATQGADIVLAARSEAEPTSSPGTILETATEVQAAGRRALPVKTDLRRMEDMEALVQRAVKAFGRIDVLVNNAADTSDRLFDSFSSVTRESWETQIAVNVSAPLWLSRLVAPVMKQQGGGVILNITSQEGRIAESKMGAKGMVYGVTKAALDRLTLGMAADLESSNIAVIALDPGYTPKEYSLARSKNQGIIGMYGGGHSMNVPVSAAIHLITRVNPLENTGKVVIAKDLVARLKLV